MEINLKDSGQMIRKKKGYFCFPMDLNMKDNFRVINFKEKGPSFIKMGVSMKDN